MRVVDQRVEYPVPSRSGSYKVKSISHCLRGQHSMEKTCFEEIVCSTTWSPKDLECGGSYRIKSFRAGGGLRGPGLERQILERWIDLLIGITLLGAMTSIWTQDQHSYPVLYLTHFSCLSVVILTTELWDDLLLREVEHIHWGQFFLKK